MDINSYYQTHAYLYMSQYVLGVTISLHVSLVSVDVPAECVQSDSRGGGGNQPPPSHACRGLLFADMFQDGPKELITEAVVLAPVEAILFFGK